MKLKFKFLTRTAALIVVLACAFSLNIFGQACPILSLTGSNPADVNLLYTLSPYYTPTRSESSARSLYCPYDGNIWDYEVVVIDDYAHITLYGSKQPSIPHALTGTYPFLDSHGNGLRHTLMDVRLNSTADAALVLFVDNSSGTDNLYAQIFTINASTGCSGSGLGISLTPGTKTLIQAGATGKNITNIALDLDWTDQLVMTWTLNGEVFGAAGNMSGTTFTWSGNKVQITDLNTSGYIRPSYSLHTGHPAGPANTFEGGDVCIYHTYNLPVGDTTIVTFLMRDEDNTTGTGSTSGDNFGIITYQMNWRDLYSGNAGTSGAYTRQNDGTPNTPIFQPAITTAINLPHPSLATHASATNIDHFNFAAIFEDVPSSGKTEIRTYTHYHNLTTAAAKNLCINPYSDMQTGNNNRPEITFSGNYITAAWNFANTTSVCSTTGYIAAVKLNQDGSGLDAIMSGNQVIEINNEQCPFDLNDLVSVCDPLLKSGATTSSYDYYTYYDRGGLCTVGTPPYGNYVWLQSRPNSTINKKEINNGTTLELINIDNISIYPNPANNQLTIDPGITVGTGSIEFNIYDIQGRLLKSNVYNGNNVEYANISALANGNYIISLKRNGKTNIGKIIVAHN